MTEDPGLLLVVGNDVVDLTLPRTRGKSEDRRFLARILDPVEQAYVNDAAEGDLELWCLWAAKEACYKIASKLLPQPPVFEHAAFGVRWSAVDTPVASDAPLRAGTVTWQDVAATVRVHHGGGYVHAVGHVAGAADLTHTISVAVERLDAEGAAWDGDEDTLRGRLTAREADAVHSRASAAVRLGARTALSGAMGVDEDRLEVVCAPGVLGRRPPSVLMDGETAPVSVSLSHDGAWIAWVWSLAG